VGPTRTLFETYKLRVILILKSSVYMVLLSSRFVDVLGTPHSDQIFYFLSIFE